jgi:hypothetical protein
MKAKRGDRLVVASSQLDHPPAVGEILEVHGSEGDPPFLVRWDGDGHETLVFPGPDARVITPESAGRG